MNDVRRRYQLLLTWSVALLLFLTACGDLESAGNINQPERPPEGAFGVSETFSGPYLGVDNPVADPADAPILEVEPGGTFYARAVYESLVGITDITVSLVNTTPEGLAGPLDPTQSFFTLGAPTSISEPGGGCELTGEDAEVTCIYEIQVAEDAVNVSELEGAQGEFAYTFTSEATNAAGVTSDEALRAYIVVKGDEAEEPEPKPEPVVCTDPVEIPDEAFRAVLRDVLALEFSERAITCEDLETLERLTYSGELDGVSSLEGVQYATNLEAISLRIDDERQTRTSISDLSPLANLTQLREIDIETEDRNIEDISPLSGLVNLERLQLRGNAISDLSALAGLSNLTELTLNANSVSDLSPLRSLTNLERLELSSNEIRDLGGLENLTSLRYLGLIDNQVSDLSPLQNLTALQTLSLGDNSPDSNAVSDLSPLQNLINLTDLDLGGNQVSDLSPLEGLTNLESLGLSYNQITDLSPLVNNGGLGPNADAPGVDDTVTLTNNPLETCPGTQGREDIEALIERGVFVRFDEPENCDGDSGNGETCTNPVNIPDQGLRQAILLYLTVDVADRSAITCEELAELVELRLNPLDSGFVDNLEGLQYAVNLEEFFTFDVTFSADELAPIRNLTKLKRLGLTLLENEEDDFSFLENLSELEFLRLESLAGERLEDDVVRPTVDLSQLRNLAKLTDLHLSFFTLNDLSPLQSLTTLTSLRIDSGGISDIEPLRNLTNLTSLRLGYSEISDVSPLQNLTGLSTLNLSGNQISDLSALQNLTNLTELSLGYNRISTFSPQSLTNLTALELDGNEIDDLSPLQTLTNLTSLNLSVNKISNISPLQDLTGLSNLTLSNNQISDLNPLPNFADLISLDLSDNKISDLEPLVANEGIKNDGDAPNVSLFDNPLNLCLGSEDLANIDKLTARSVSVSYEGPQDCQP